LRKREAYRAAFAGFDPARVAEFGEAEIAAAVSNPGLVRHEGKIRATIGNARALLEVRREFGSFDAYQWRFVEGPPLVRAPSSDIPVSTDVSVAFSKDLKRRGFKFVGPTIMYAYMQAVGMVNDHLISCFRYAELNG
jgi:DNA-3-methyladenine glycosylase I